MIPVHKTVWNFLGSISGLTWKPVRNSLMALFHTRLYTPWYTMAGEEEDNPPMALLSGQNFLQVVLYLGNSVLALVAIPTS